MKQNRTKRNQSKRKKRNQMRRSNCRYSGSLGRFEIPYCRDEWEFIAEKDAKIIGKLADNEKLCKNPKYNFYQLIKYYSDKDLRNNIKAWYFDRDRDGYDKDGYDKDGYDKDGYHRNGFGIY
jgi:hypothetical protein